MFGLVRVAEVRREDCPVNATPPAKKAGLRALWIVVPGIIFFGILAAATFNKGGPPQRGDAAPAFAGQILGSSEELSSEDLKGRPMVVNFWASWCKPCEDEAPMLQQAFERYGDEVTFIGINANDALDDALAKEEEWGLGYDSIRDIDGSISSDFGLTGQPETFFIAADGTVSEHVRGPLFEGDLFILLEALAGPGG
jgi:cytochrome c biogenesis protein CcmG, thiol:disulfide interchange protein DsbE